MKIVDTSLSLTVPQTAAPILAIRTGLQVQLSNNPGTNTFSSHRCQWFDTCSLGPLTFIVIGSFQGKSITIAGGMIGDWVRTFLYSSDVSVFLSKRSIKRWIHSDSAVLLWEMSLSKLDLGHQSLLPSFVLDLLQSLFSAQNISVSISIT